MVCRLRQGKPVSFDETITLEGREIHLGTVRFPLRDYKGDVVDFAEDGTYRLSEAQARAILELRLQRLTGLERDKIVAEYKALLETIAHLEEKDNPELVANLITRIAKKQDRCAAATCRSAKSREPTVTLTQDW